ncbi:hypothetical protein ABZ863_04170 [Saccharomonospora sp. NPDC046836]|uniref:hypothetical protein n=1 Tax=Saccharomonospora sp. NPDC046836 TaxID=3156921 RepID=UPI0033CE3D5D
MIRALLAVGVNTGDLGLAPNENINFFGAIEIDIDGELAQLDRLDHRPRWQAGHPAAECVARPSSPLVRAIAATLLRRNFRDFDAAEKPVTAANLKWTHHSVERVHPDPHAEPACHRAARIYFRSYVFRGYSSSISVVEWSAAVKTKPQVSHIRPIFPSTTAAPSRALPAGLPSASWTSSRYAPSCS